MKAFTDRLKRTRLALIILSTIFFGCDKGADPTTVEQALNILKSKTWQINSVTVDGTDKTSDFAGMTITFTDNLITTVNGGELWQPEDTWQFTSADATIAQRGDGLELRLATLTPSSLEVELSWNKETYGPGRARSTQGEYVFSFE